jgi:hypothetical protein
MSYFSTPLDLAIKHSQDYDMIEVAACPGTDLLLPWQLSIQKNSIPHEIN